MSAFMNEDFLLNTPVANKLYHDYAAKMPIVDYHCHVPPQAIAEDMQFDNIAQLFLGGDHYKWRLMRACGVDEKYITGAATDREKFQKYAEILPSAIGNPVYTWTHLELKRYFNYEGNLNAQTAEEVWNLSQKIIQSKDFTVRNIIKKSNVTAICTTDDPIDDLRWHKMLKEDKSFDVKVLPAYRPDKAINLEKPEFAAYIKSLSAASGVEIKSAADVCTALSKTMDLFAEMGCLASDHGVDYVYYREDKNGKLEDIFQKGINNQELTLEEKEIYKTAILLFLGREYAKRGWVMQIHYGAIRNTNSTMAGKLGPDTGYDCISTYECSEGIVKLMDALNKTNELPKTILYSLNPNDDAMLASITGCFQSQPAGKIQHGSAWWFNDTKDGMTAQMKSLAARGVIGNFVGMLTDSRSFLSYPRHEYFRRILCGIIGEWVENGEYPEDYTLLGEIVQNISYNNAINYLGIKF